MKPLFFAVKNKKKSIRLKSSSGGMFSLLAKYVFRNKGVVYGVAFNKNFEVEHIRITNKEDLERLRGSKYVRSEFKGIFLQVKKDLDKKRLVLFSGTPCQVTGLKAFLGDSNKDNLITVDNICHGTPSPKIFKAFLEELEIRNNSKIKSFRFRHKDKGWKSMKTPVEFMNGKKLIDDKFLNSYMNLFLFNVSLRKCCFNCPFTNCNRVGDITLGDFWGIEAHHPELNDEDGVSLVLVNTEKGKEVFDKIKNGSYYTESSKEKAMQPSLRRPAKCPVDCDKFWDEFDKYGYEYIAKKYSSYGLLRRMRLFIFYTMPRKIIGKIGLKKFLKRKLSKYL